MHIDEIGQNPPVLRGGLSRLSQAIVAAATAAALLFSGNAAQAQTSYPDHEVTWLVGFPAGSFFDLTTRLFAEQFAAELGQTFVVEPRPGAGSIIATAAAAQAAPDGYTLLTTADIVWSTLPFMNKDLPYDPATAFVPVYGMTLTPFLVTVPADSPFTTIEDLVAFAAANPGKLRAGTVGLGTTSHLAGALMWQEAKVEMINVTYNGGGEMNVDLMGGRLDVAIDVPTSALPYIADGKLRGLVALSSERIPALPEMPTASELGYVNVKMQSAMMLVAPAGTPQDVVDTLAAAAKTALAAPKTDEFLSGRGLLPLAIGGAELEAYIQEAVDRNRSLIETLGLTAQ